MAPSAEDEEAHFLATQYRVKGSRDLLDELADIEDEMSSSDPLVVHWNATGLNRKDIPIWRAAMYELVPTDVRNEDCAGPDPSPSIDATPPHEDYARAAARWHQAGFTPDEAKEWTHAIDIHDGWRLGAALADDWRSRGFTSEQAQSWVQGAVSPADDAEHSQIFRDADWHPFLVWTLYCFLGREGEDWANRSAWAPLPVTHALNCARAGLTPSEAESVLPMDAQSLEAHLNELFEARGRIDPYIAMHFNHHQWQANGCEDDDAKWEFYARRLWDLHDEADNKARSAGKRPPYGGPNTKKPLWKSLEERADREKAETARPMPVQCSNSGGRGDLEFRDGMEDWYVHCQTCGVTWMGGKSDPLPAHDRPPGR